LLSALQFCQPGHFEMPRRLMTGLSHHKIIDMASRNIARNARTFYPERSRNKTDSNPIRFQQSMTAFPVISHILDRVADTVDIFHKASHKRKYPLYLPSFYNQQFVPRLPISIPHIQENVTKDLRL